MNIIEATKRFPSRAKVKKLKIRVVKELADEITQMVIVQQLFGLDKSDKRIVPQYANAYYATRKQRLNSRPSYGTPDLELTGNMHDKMKLFVKGNTYDFNSSVSYFKFVKSKYENAFGVADSNKNEIHEMTTERFLELFYDELRKSN